jgi:hypothetical protein
VGEAAGGGGVGVVEGGGFGEEGEEVRFVFGQVEVVDGDVAALGEEGEGDGAADAGGAAGYDGRLAREI